MAMRLVSGGYAVVQPDSQLSINAVEAYSLDSFSPEAIRAQLAEAHKIAGGSGSEHDITEAKIEIEVYALRKCSDRLGANIVLFPQNRFWRLFRVL